MNSVYSNPSMNVGSIRSVAEILDPRMDIRCNDEKLHAFIRGPSYCDEEIYPSNSFGTQNTNWAQNTTSISDITEKDFWQKHYVQFDFKDGVGNPVAPFGASGIPTNPAYEGPRSWPVQSVQQTLQVKLNGQNFNVNPQEYLHAQLRYHVKKFNVELDYSTFPSMEDAVANYDDALLYGSSRNPFAGINENDAEMTRNAQWPVQVLNAGTTLRYEFMEPLFISPLNVGRKMTEGLTSLNRWEVTILWGNLSRMWSASANNALSKSVTTTFYKAPEIVLRFLKRTRRMEIERPMKCAYPYFRPIQFVKSNNLLPAYNLNPLSSTVVSSDTVQFNQIPNALLVFLRQPSNSVTFTDSDTFARIVSVSVYYNGVRLLSNANEQQVYQIAKKNGYNQSFQQWAQLTGSVLMLKFGEDIGLPEGEAAGMLQQRTVQVQVTCVNLLPTQQNFDYYLIPIFAGSIEISDDSCYAYDGILTPQLVALASRSPSLNYGQYRMYQSLNGAGFFDSLKHIVNKGARAVSSVARIAEDVLPPEYAGYARQARGIADVTGRLSR